LIERAWIGRHHPQALAPMEDVNATLDLIRYILKHKRWVAFLLDRGNQPSHQEWE
jgi:hypothetical protein